MAFRQPTFAPQRSVARHYCEDATTLAIDTRNQAIDESQEWVLFSPRQEQSTITPSERDTHLSDFGSLTTVPRTDKDAQTEEEEDALGDTDDLDSLDDGLLAFRDHDGYELEEHDIEPSGALTTSILPAHDGLGTFQSSSQEMQAQIWSHERHNPRRKVLVRRGSSSVIREDEELSLEGTRMERIERWRAEHARVLVEEIEKETKRRTSRTASEVSSKRPAVETQDAEAAANAILDASRQVAHSTEEQKESETFWQQITRRLIRDLIGIDESLLSILFGESLAKDDDLSSTPKPNSMLHSRLGGERGGFSALEPLWEDRLLHRLARELGVLVQHLSTQPPLSSLTTSANMDYAGMPVVGSPNPKTQVPEEKVDQEASRSTSAGTTNPSAVFMPTIPASNVRDSATEHAALWGIEEEEETPTPVSIDPEADYWERTPDLKSIFSYLSRRFLFRRRNTSPTSAHTQTQNPNPFSSVNIATLTTPDSLRRAALIRQHHPLTSRQPFHSHHTRRLSQHNLNLRRRPSIGGNSAPSFIQQPVTSGPSGISQLIAASRDQSVLGGAHANGSASLKRAGESCASVSTKRSRRSDGSRRYWDLGGSVDSASLVLGGQGGGAWGGWGEV